MWLAIGQVSVKTKSCHDANFVIIGGTTGCRYDNLWCHQWWQSWHHDDSVFRYQHDDRTSADSVMIVLALYGCQIHDEINGLDFRCGEIASKALANHQLIFTSQGIFTTAQGIRLGYKCWGLGLIWVMYNWMDVGCWCKWKSACDRLLNYPMCVVSTRLSFGELPTRSSTGGHWVNLSPCHISNVVCYCGITWSLSCLKSPATQLYVQQLTQANNKENIKGPHSSLLWGESASDQWIPLTNGP